MRRLRDERGAITILISLMICFLVVPLAALAVDLGVQRVARRDMQSMADVVALDLSRDVDGVKDAATILGAWGCAPSAAGECAAASTNEVGRSAARNTSTTGDAPAVSAQLGCANAAGTFAPLGGVCLKPDAVQVSSRTEVDFNFLGAEKGGAVRTALGRSKRTACFHLGSFAARFRSSDSDLVKQAAAGLLDDILGVDLDLVSYQGLAAADVSLADLAAESQIGGVDQLLGGKVTLGELFAATYAVLNRENEPKNSVALSLLNTPGLWAGIDMATEIELSDILAVSTGDDAALQGQFNVLDLIGGAIALANGENFLSLDRIGIAGLVNPAASYVKVIQGMSGPLCGRPDVPGEAEGYSSQVKAHLEGPLAPGAIAGLTTSLGGYSVDLDLGHAFGDLVGTVHCGAGIVGNEDRYTVRASSGLAKATIAANIKLDGTISGSQTSLVDVPLLNNVVQSLLGILLGNIVRIEYHLQVSFAATTVPGTTPAGDVQLLVPQNALNSTPQGTPATVTTSSPLSLPALPAASVTGSVKVYSGLLGTTVTTVDVGSNQGIVAPLLTTVRNTLNNNATLTSITSGVNNELTRLGKLLGIGLGGADLYSREFPECNGADLIG